MSIFKIAGITAATLVATLPLALRADDSCHPAIDPTKTQYIVGYGSLMEKASKERSTPNAGPNHPVIVKGYQREWNTKGGDTGFSTTYLGVTIAPGAAMNAAVYINPDAADIETTDAREEYYCRNSVPAEAITMLDGTDLLSNHQIWIYYNKPDSRVPPSARWPIVQSYVDIFLNGCMELETKVVTTDGNASFAQQCILSTNGWSSHWVNDRIYPRRPFIYRKSAGSIDALIYETLPTQITDGITIE